MSGRWRNLEIERRLNDYYPGADMEPLTDARRVALRAKADGLSGRLDDAAATALCHAYGFRTRAEVDEIMVDDDERERRRIEALRDRQKRNDERIVAKYVARAANIRRTLETEQLLSAETAAPVRPPQRRVAPSARSPRGRVPRRVRRVTRAAGRARPPQADDPEPALAGGRGWL